MTKVSISMASGQCIESSVEKNQRRPTLGVVASYTPYSMRVQADIDHIVHPLIVIQLTDKGILTLATNRATKSLLPSLSTVRRRNYKSASPSYTLELCFTK
eukprot:gene5877-6797_t